MTNNIQQAFYEAWGIEKRWVEIETENYGTSYHGFPTLTPERILALEEIILHSKGNCDYQFKKDEGKYYCSCGELWNYRQGIGKTRSDALLSLLTQLKPELSEKEQEQVRRVFE